jgi:hypothetical protein
MSFLGTGRHIAKHKVIDGANYGARKGCAGAPTFAASA